VFNGLWWQFNLLLSKLLFQNIGAKSSAKLQFFVEKISYKENFVVQGASTLSARP
jgi:hypothetical protein